MRKTLLESIDRWKQAAALGVDDVGGWRDAAPSRKDWPAAPERFYLDTSYIVGRITSDFPKLDPEPLQGVYSAISVWHNEHHANNLPPQAVLFSTLERAMTTLGVVSDSLLVKPEANETTPEATSQQKFVEAMNPRQLRIAAIAEDTKRSAEEKMKAIVAIDPDYANTKVWKGERWGKLLGVSGAAIRGLAFWRQLQNWAVKTVPYDGYTGEYDD